MKRFCVFFLFLILSLRTFSQVVDISSSPKCAININDSVHQYFLELSQFNGETINVLDAKDVLNMQTFDFSCDLSLDTSAFTGITLYGFRYKLFRKNKLFLKAKHEGSAFYNEDDDFYKLIYNSVAGDSIIIYDLRSSIDWKKNVKKKYVIICIRENSILKPDKNEIKLFNKIHKIPIFDLFSELYPGCGGCSCFYRTKPPYYNKDKSKLLYECVLGRWDWKVDEKTDSITQVTINDFDFTIIYHVKADRISVFDNKLHKELGVNKWIENAYITISKRE